MVVFVNTCSNGGGRSPAPDPIIWFTRKKKIRLDSFNDFDAKIWFPTQKAKACSTQ